MNNRPIADHQEHEREFAHLHLEDMGTLGDTLAWFEGQQINVFGGIPDEEVVAEVVRFRRRRKKLVSAIVTEALKPSPHRVAPPCAYFGTCTGCQWQHVDYAYQLTLKRESVEREMRKYHELDGVPVGDTMPAPDLHGYRNHARFTVRRQGSLGFINRVTRRFVRIDECMLMTPGINEILRQLQGNCEETSQLSVRYGIHTSDYLVQPTLQRYDVTVPSGQTHYRETVLGRSFRIASPSFFQVNTKQAERLALLVRDRLDLTGNETLVDAYAGVGTFAVLLAPFAQEVIAIEESEAAVKDATVNANGIGNLDFLMGKTEDMLHTLDDTLDAIILDPPRVGCHPAVLDEIVRRAPSRTVYVSCDATALAKDLNRLAQSGLKVESIEPVDMFPQTHHVECVATIRPRG